MGFGEILARWAIIIGFALLALVTGTAALLLVSIEPPQPGNPTVLFVVAALSTVIALWLYRNLQRLRR